MPASFFSMYMTGLHLKHCGLVQAEMDPCVYYKIVQDKKDLVVGYLIVITWVDNCRYFGTDDLVAEYEKNVQKRWKCVGRGKQRVCFDRDKSRYCWENSYTYSD
jgi:hypothetical protein